MIKFDQSVPAEIIRCPVVIAWLASIIASKSTEDFLHKRVVGTAKKFSVPFQLCRCTLGGREELERRSNKTGFNLEKK